MSNDIYRSDKHLTLVRLREEAGLSQQKVAEFFGLKSRDAVSKWESGITRPRAKQRSRFIAYLLDKLGLRRRPDEFMAIWQEVMVKKWRWDPFSEEELRAYLPRSAKTMIADKENWNFPFLVPAQNPHHSVVGRDEILEEMKRHLIGEGALTLALYGISGVGKTTLAIELAHDPSLLTHFKDGVLWAGLQKEPDIMNKLRLWVIALGIEDKAANFANDQIAELLRTELSQRKVLIILDDVWDIESALALKLGGTHCAHIITTRLPEIALQFANDRYAHQILELDESHSLDLIRELAPNAHLEETDAQLKALVKALAGLPLGLVLVGNQLRVEAHSNQARLFLTIGNSTKRPSKKSPK